MEKKRKIFQNLPSEENPHFLKDGIELYNLMRQKYPENTNEHLDNILNGLCASLTVLMYQNVKKENHKYFIQLIYKILTQNDN